jgi:RNA polymerase primary sigma factor
LGTSPEDSLLAAETTQVLDGIIGTLTPREQRVLQIRFHKDGTLEDAAKAFDVTRERIRQIEAKALRKMRHPDRTKSLVEAGLAKKTHSGGVELDD